MKYNYFACKCKYQRQFLVHPVASSLRCMEALQRRRISIIIISINFVCIWMQAGRLLIRSWQDLPYFTRPVTQVLINNHILTHVSSMYLSALQVFPLLPSLLFSILLTFRKRRPTPHRLFVCWNKPCAGPQLSFQ